MNNEGQKKNFKENKKEEKKKEQFIDADVSNQPTDMLSNNSFEEKEG